MSAANPDVAPSVRLVARREVAERTFAFDFEKPPGWTFEPGQYTDVTLRSPPETDEKGNTRTFSIASAPQEDRVTVASRIRGSAFKRVLQSAPLGTPVELKGPAGGFTLHRNPGRTAVILSGGIGITPFRSIAFDAARRRLPHRIVLFFANRRPEDAPFLDELQRLESENPNFRFVPTMTQPEKSIRPWKGEVGRIGPELLARHLKAPASPIYYIAGPPGMVKGLRQMLDGAGADPDDIRTEEFDGY